MDDTYSYVSPSYQKKFDHFLGPLVGQPYHVTIHPDDLAVCKEIGEKCFENPNQLFPATIRKLDGKEGYVFTQWEFQSIWNDAGEPEGIFCLGYNITEYELTRTQLASVRTEIEQKIEQLNQIGYMQAHIIRKPLANIMGLINILSQMEMGANLQNITTLLQKSAEELDEVVKDIIYRSA